MEGTAKLIAAIAALIGVLVWPTIVTLLAVGYRKDLRAALSRLPALLDRLRKFKAPFIEGELDSLADRAPERGEITPDQVRVAARVTIDTRTFGTEDVTRELDKLCLEYDTLRRTMPGSRARTREMTRIVVKMRALAQSTSERLEAYKGSGSPGSRLAAVAMMQMEPSKADLDWLLNRFSSEVPFIFYHASLALTNVTNTGSAEDRERVISVANAALKIVRSFVGVPDQQTLEVLEALCDC